MFKLQTVENIEIPNLAELANNIWHEYWPCILSNEQIDYMVDKFQSKEAILNQLIHEKYSYYFVIIDEQICGYVGLALKDKYLFLSKLYLLKDFRHKGIGNLVIQEIKQIAQKEKFKSIQLTVNKYNTNTIEAYKKYGFKVIDQVVTDIGNGFVMDDYIMEYTLN